MSYIRFSHSRNPRFENLVLSYLEILEIRLWRICVFFDMVRQVDSHQQVIITPRNTEGFRIWKFGHVSFPANNDALSTRPVSLPGPRRALGVSVRMSTKSTIEHFHYAGNLQGTPTWLCTKCLPDKAQLQSCDGVNVASSCEFQEHQQ